MSVAHQIRSFSPNARRILVSTFFAGLGSSGFALLYNLYLLSLGYHADFIGLVASVTTLSTASAGPAAFMLSRRIPLGRILTFGFLLQVIGCTGLALSGATAGILAFSVVFGLSQGFYWAPLPPFLAENSSSEERNHLFSINIAVQLLAGILGYLAAGQAPSLLAGALVLEPTGSLRTTLLIATAAAGLALLPMLTVRRAIPAPGQPKTVAAVAEGEESGQRHVVALGHRPWLWGCHRALVPLLQRVLRHAAGSQRGGSWADIRSEFRSEHRRGADGASVGSTGGLRPGHCPVSPGCRGGHGCHGVFVQLGGSDRHLLASQLRAADHGASH